MLNGQFFSLNNCVLSRYNKKINFPITARNQLCKTRFCSTTIETGPTKQVKRYGIVFPEKKFAKVPELPAINLKKIRITPFRSHNTTKTNSKNLHTQIEFRFEVEKATWIPIEIRSVLYERTKHKLNKQGELIIAAFKYKSRQANYRDALSRLKQLIVDARNVAMGVLTDKDKRAYTIHRNRDRRARRRKKEEKIREALLVQLQANKINKGDTSAEISNKDAHGERNKEVNNNNNNNNNVDDERNNNDDEVFIFAEENYHSFDYDYDYDSNIEEIIKKRSYVTKVNGIKE
jgi:hypothetical protein